MSLPLSSCGYARIRSPIWFLRKGFSTRVPPSHPEPTVFSGKPRKSERPSNLTDSLGSVRGGMKKGLPRSSPYSQIHANPPVSPSQTNVNPNMKPEVQMFAGSGRPLLRTLPKIPRVWPKVLLGLVIVLPLWGGFLFTVWNQEKLSSSIYLQIMRTLRSAPSIRELIGDALRIEPVWWMNGEGIVWGEISHPSGSIDLSFRVKGTVASGTVYFTSVRKQKGGQWTLLRFRVISDDGEIANIDPRLGWSFPSSTRPVGEDSGEELEGDMKLSKDIMIPQTQPPRLV